MYEKNNFTGISKKISKNLARLKSENNFVEPLK